MKKEKVLGIFGDKIKTESGMKTITGNLIPKIGDYVYADGNHILGGNKRHGKTTPLISTPKNPVFIELIRTGTKDIYNFRIVTIKNGIYKILKEYETFELKKYIADRYCNYDRFVYDENNICIFSHEYGMYVTYKRQNGYIRKNIIEAQKRYYDSYIVLAEYVNDDLMVWHHPYGWISIDINEDGETCEFTRMCTANKYKNFIEISNYDVTMEAVRQMKIETKNYKSKLKSFGGFSEKDIYYTAGDLEIIAIKPETKRTISLITIRGAARNNEIDDMYISVVYFIEKFRDDTKLIKSEYWKSTTRGGDYNTSGNGEYYNITYPANDEFYDIKLNEDYNLVYPVNRLYPTNILKNKKLGIKDMKTGNIFWIQQFIQNFGDFSYGEKGRGSGEMVVSDCEKNKILIHSYENNTTHVYDTEARSLKKIIKPSGIVMNRQYVSVDLSKAKSLIEGFMKKL